MGNEKNLKDHREIGREQELFFTHEYAPGAIFWLPKGWIIYQALRSFISETIKEEGYQEISTPVMVKNTLFKQSGHWEHYGENMFNLKVENEEYSLKPMNCPETALIFAHKNRSYKDLPLRLSEFGILHRNELSGVLGGLLRVRQFVIDDAHLFVRKDQIQEEILKLLTLVGNFYRLLGFEPRFYLATRPDKAMGDEAVWEEAETDLEEALKKAGVKYGVKEKDGAFYGPKIDTHIEDSQGRDWQLATIQLDFMIPEKMKLEYLDENNQAVRPVMIHRGIFGSIERFVGILIEHLQGSFPLWLSPVQTVIIPVTDRSSEYALEINKKLTEKNIRSLVDNRAETMQARIRDQQLQKVPSMIIVGDREVDSKNISVRNREGQTSTQSLEEFIQKITDEISQRSL